MTRKAYTQVYYLTGGLGGRGVRFRYFTRDFSLGEAGVAATEGYTVNTESGLLGGLEGRT